jgi:hypothetical protein
MAESLRGNRCARHGHVQRIGEATRIGSGCSTSTWPASCTALMRACPTFKRFAEVEVLQARDIADAIV